MSDADEATVRTSSRTSARTTTRLQLLSAFCDNLLEDDGPEVFSALQDNGIRRVAQLCSLEPSDIDMFNFSLGVSHRLIRLNKYWKALDSQERNEMKMLALDGEALDTWVPEEAQSQVGGGNANESVADSTTSARSLQALAFQKGIKRSVDDYKKLDSDAIFDSWIEEFEVTAGMHGLFNLLDENYLADTTDDYELFESQQRFLYSVLFNKCVTSKSRNVVKKHMATYDAQQVLIDLKEAYKHGVAGAIQLQKFKSEFENHTMKG